MLQWFHRLMPRQEMFFPLFERHASVLHEGAEALRAMLSDGADLAPACARVLELEQQADDIARDVLIGIRTSFITPFDRSDIQGLISAMDDAIDQMQQTAKSIVLFEVTHFDPEMKAMTEEIVECARLVRRAIPMLSGIGEHAAALNEICLEITRREGHADDLHDAGLKSLYETAKSGNPLEFLRGQQIYAHLEECADRFDDIANKIQGIVIEQV